MVEEGRRYDPQATGEQLAAWTVEDLVSAVVVLGSVDPGTDNPWAKHFIDAAVRRVEGRVEPGTDPYAHPYVRAVLGACGLLRDVVVVHRAKHGPTSVETLEVEEKRRRAEP